MRTILLFLMAFVIPINNIYASKRKVDRTGEYYYQHGYDPKKHSYKHIRIKLEIEKDSTYRYWIWYSMNNNTCERRFSSGRWYDRDKYILLDCEFVDMEYNYKIIHQDLTGFKYLERMSIYLSKKGKNKLKLNEKVLKHAK